MPRVPFSLSSTDGFLFSVGSGAAVAVVVDLCAPGVSIEDSSLLLYGPVEFGELFPRDLLSDIRLRLDS